MSANRIASVIGIGQTTGEVPIGLLTDLAKQGLASIDPVVRLHLWELFLHVLPLDRTKWQMSMEQRQSMYHVWVEKYFANAKNWLDLDFPVAEVKIRDFGLEDDDVMAQIHGDLIRTPYSSFAEIGLGSTHEEVRPHMRRIERILYIFSCLNAAYNYTQGFNELAFPMYHVAILASKQMNLSDDFGEACAFFLLQNLITGTGLGDLFTMEHDFDSVASKFDLIKEMMKIVDIQLHNHMFIKLNLTPLQFAFSWVSVLFYQLYSIDGLLTLWDRFLLKESNIVEFGMAIGAAHLVERREDLLKMSFSQIMDHLHNLKDFDPATIIARAEDIWVQYLSMNQ